MFILRRGTRKIQRGQVFVFVSLYSFHKEKKYKRMWEEKKSNEERKHTYMQGGFYIKEL